MLHHFKSFYAFWFDASYVQQEKYLKTLGSMKYLDFSCSHLVHKIHQWNYDKKIDKKKLRVTLEVLDKLSTKYPETGNYNEENMTEVCVREKLSVWEVFCFVLLCLDEGCLSSRFACLWVFEWVDGLIFRALAGSFQKVDKWDTYFLWWSAKFQNMLI